MENQIEDPCPSCPTSFMGNPCGDAKACKYWLAWKKEDDAFRSACGYAVLSFDLAM